MTERQRGSGVSPGMETHLIALADEAETSLKRLLPRIEARVRSETDPTEWNALTLRSGPEVGIGGPYQSWIQESFEFNIQPFHTILPLKGSPGSRNPLV